MSRNKESRKYLIGRFYNDEFDWPFDFIIVTWKNNQENNQEIARVSMGSLLGQTLAKIIMT